MHDDDDFSKTLSTADRDEVGSNSCVRRQVRAVSITASPSCHVMVMWVISYADISPWSCEEAEVNDGESASSFQVTI